MRIIETCPKCGADIEDLQIATNPPIPVKRCTKCDWRWEGSKDDDVIRVPFTPPAVDPWKYGVAPNAEYWIPECCRNCSNHPRNGGSGVCACTLPYISSCKNTGTSSTEYTIETSSTTTTEYMFGEDDGCG